MEQTRIAAIWHKHSSYNDRGYESLDTKIFYDFREAEHHLRKQSGDDGDFGTLIAIESTRPIVLGSVNSLEWVSLSCLDLKENYIRKLESIGFQMKRENLASKHHAKISP